MFIPDPNFFPSRIHIKNYLNPKKLFLSSRKYDPGCSSRILIRIRIFSPSRIPFPGVKKAPDPGSGSATLPDPQHCIIPGSIFYGSDCADTPGWCWTKPMSGRSTLTFSWRGESRAAESRAQQGKQSAPAQVCILECTGGFLCGAVDF